MTIGPAKMPIPNRTTTPTPMSSIFIMPPPFLAALFLYVFLVCHRRLLNLCHTGNAKAVPSSSYEIFIIFFI